MLREVVTSGTGYNLDTDLYTAAGKTGTAENEANMHMPGSLAILM